jgi:AraC-like DNA-binding protein
MQAGPFMVSHKAYAPGFCQPLHEHPIAAIDLNVRGGGQGRYHREERASRAGEVEYFHAGVPHSFTAGARGIRTLHVSFDPAVPGALGHSPRFDASPDQPDATGAAALILAELADPDRSSPLVIEECAVRMLGATFRLAPPERGEPRWVGGARRLLSDNIAGEFSLAELAALLGVDRAHLARTFHARTGMTCGQYHRRARIAAAQRLLAGTDAPISRVAHQTGFADQAHLTRWFWRVSGWTPAAFARTMREDTPARTGRACPSGRNPRL